MKANELMIGDWVYIFDPDYKEDKQAYQVSEVREEGIRTYMFSDTYEEDWFEPIPLTEDILKKNRFKKYGIVWNFPSNSFFGVMIDTSLKGIYSTYNMTAFFRCGYVHELQRALRCCGLFELADNFKIE